MSKTTKINNPKSSPQTYTHLNPRYPQTSANKSLKYLSRGQPHQPKTSDIQQLPKQISKTQTLHQGNHKSYWNHQLKKRHQNKTSLFLTRKIARWLIVVSLLHHSTAEHVKKMEDSRCSSCSLEDTPCSQLVNYVDLLDAGKIKLPDADICRISCGCIQQSCLEESECKYILEHHSIDDKIKEKKHHQKVLEFYKWKEKI